MSPRDSIAARSSQAGRQLPPAWQAPSRSARDGTGSPAPSRTDRGATVSRTSHPRRAARWSSGWMPRSRASTPPKPALTRWASCTRTVFDPLTIVTANGDWAPYLAQSVVPNSDYTAWTITLRPNLVFHDGSPCSGAALLANFKAHSKSVLTGVVINPTLQSITQTGPLAVTISFKSP